MVLNEIGQFYQLNNILHKLFLTDTKLIQYGVTNELSACNEYDIQYSLQFVIGLGRKYKLQTFLMEGINKKTISKMQNGMRNGN
jgi:hypothetical protein